ncbi:MAG: type 4a pilus biogenesis protein PilO, partial [Thermoanaerobacterales bacterium]|nr:type 4a pilus biogenesis protein PilO [Thermoanaerobacterales bacterium]
MADTKRFSSGLLTVLLGVLALAAMAFLLYTQYGALNAARDAAAGEQVAVARARARLAELKQAKEQAAALEERLAAFDRLLPAEPDEDVLITDLQNEADRSGTRLLQIR